MNLPISKSKKHSKYSSNFQLFNKCRKNKETLASLAPTNLFYCSEENLFSKYRELSDFFYFNSPRSTYYTFSKPKTFIENPLPKLSTYVITGDLSLIISYLENKMNNLQGMKNANVLYFTKTMQNSFNFQEKYFISNIDYDFTLKDEIIADNFSKSLISQTIIQNYSPEHLYKCINNSSFMIISETEVNRIKKFIKENKNKQCTPNCKFLFLAHVNNKADILKEIKEFNFSKNDLEKETSKLIKIVSEEIFEYWSLTLHTSDSSVFYFDNQNIIFEEKLCSKSLPQGFINYTFNIYEFTKLLEAISKDIDTKIDLNMVKVSIKFESPVSQYIEETVMKHIQQLKINKKIAHLYSNGKDIDTLMFERTLLIENEVQSIKTKPLKF